MSFQGINFSSQHIVPSDDGRLYEAIFEDGALHGCELSYVGAALTIGAGYLMIGGREIEITEDEVFNINEATSGYAQLVLSIDLTQTATIGAFNQVSIDVRYASTEAGFASLIQDDINGAGTKYQQQLALVSLGTGGITGIVAGMPSASLKGAGRVFSIIAVTYPAGSICTCSNGTKTLKARDTSGKALFNVPSDGTWAVSCTDGTRTAMVDVSITADGQVESVTLMYYPSDGLIARYSFDSFAGNTTDDSSGNEYNLTLTNVTQTTGVVGKAASFAGNGGAVANSKVIPADMSGFTGLSVSFWIKASTQTENAYLLSEGNKPSEFLIQLTNEGKILFSRSFQDTTYATVNKVIATNTWRHVCILYNYSSALCTCYIDGTSVGESWSLGKFTKASANLTIGKHPLEDLSYFSGALDQVYIYNRVITDDEIALLFNGGYGC